MVWRTTRWPIALIASAVIIFVLDLLALRSKVELTPRTGREAKGYYYGDYNGDYCVKGANNREGPKVEVGRRQRRRQRGTLGVISKGKYPGTREGGGEGGREGEGGKAKRSQRSKKKPREEMPREGTNRGGSLGRG